MKQFILIALVMLSIIFCNRPTKNQAPKAQATQDDAVMGFIELLKSKGIAITHPADSMVDCFLVSPEAYRVRVKPLITEHNLVDFVTHNPDGEPLRVCVFSKDDGNK